MMSNKVKVFYSWQSDVKEVKDLIEKELRLAESSILKDNKLPRILVDESTANRAGSPSIPETILEKIRESDIFIADVTIINTDDKSHRKTPNPNVVFELGYAVSQLGWGRIILLNCNDNGKAEDLPFDFRSHRSTSFSLRSNNLQTEIKKAILEIIEKNPAKPSNHLSIEDKKRNKDLKNIQKIMETLHIPTIQQATRDLPYRIHHNVLDYWEYFNSVKTESLFKLYDGEFLGILDEFHHYFHNCTNGIYYEQLNNNYYRLKQSRTDIDKIIEKIGSNTKGLAKSLNKITDYLHNNYPELDIREMSKRALEKQKQMETSTEN